MVVWQPLSLKRYMQDHINRAQGAGTTVPLSPVTRLSIDRGVNQEMPTDL